MVLRKSALLGLLSATRDSTIAVSNKSTFPFSLPCDELGLWLDGNEAAPVSALGEQVVDPGIVAEGHRSRWRTYKLPEFLSTLLGSMPFFMKFCFTPSLLTLKSPST